MADGCGGGRVGRPAGGYSQLGRVLRLWLRLTEWRNLDELAAELDVSPRTVRRDLHALGAHCALECDRGDYRRVDRHVIAVAVADAVTAEREACAEVARAMLAEVAGAAAKAPASHAAGEASAARRIAAAIAARGAT